MPLFVNHINICQRLAAVHAYIFLLRIPSPRFFRDWSTRLPAYASIVIRNEFSRLIPNAFRIPSETTRYVRPSCALLCAKIQDAAGKLSYSKRARSSDIYSEKGPRRCSFERTTPNVLYHMKFIETIMQRTREERVIAVESYFSSCCSFNHR